MRMLTLSGCAVLPSVPIIFMSAGMYNGQQVEAIESTEVVLEQEH